MKKKKSNPQGLAEGKVQIGAVIDSETLFCIDGLAKVLGWSRSRIIGEILSENALDIWSKADQALKAMDHEGFHFEIKSLNQINTFPFFYELVRKMPPEELKAHGIRVWKDAK